MVIFSCSFFLVLYEYIYVHIYINYNELLYAENFLISNFFNRQVRKLLCVLFSFFIFSTCQRKTKIDEINASGGVVGVRTCKWRAFMYACVYICVC